MGLFSACLTELLLFYDCLPISWLAGEILRPNLGAEPPPQKKLLLQAGCLKQQKVIQKRLVRIWCHVFPSAVNYTFLKIYNPSIIKLCPFCH